MSIHKLHSLRLGEVDTYRYVRCMYMYPEDQAALGWQILFQFRVHLLMKCMHTNVSGFVMISLIKFGPQNLHLTIRAFAMLTTCMHSKLLHILELGFITSLRTCTSVRSFKKNQPNLQSTSAPHSMLTLVQWWVYIRIICIRKERLIELLRE